MDQLIRGQLVDFQVKRKTTVTTVLNQAARLLDILAFNKDVGDNFLQLWDVATIPTGDITAVATHADGAKYTSAAHGLSVGDEVVHEGFTDDTYNGKKTVVTVVDANNYTTSDTYTATGTGTFILAPKMVVPIPGGDGGTLYGNQKNMLPLLPEIAKGMIFESCLKYAVATTPGGKTDPTTGAWVNVFYTPA